MLSLDLSPGVRELSHVLERSLSTRVAAVAIPPDR